MSLKRNGWNRKLSFTAGLMMIAASVGGEVASSAEEAGAIDQIQRYCQASWQNARIAPTDWEDCTQEVFVDLLGRVSRRGIVPAITTAESPERRELNRSIWRTTQRWKRAPRHLALDGELHAAAPSDATDGRLTDEALVTAMARLSERQQLILHAWSRGGAIRDIAREIGVSAERASDEKYKAIQKLRGVLSRS